MKLLDFGKYLKIVYKLLEYIVCDIYIYINLYIFIIIMWLHPETMIKLGNEFF